MKRFWVTILFFFLGTILCGGTFDVAYAQVLVSNDGQGEFRESELKKDQENATLNTFYFLKGMNSYLSGDHKGAKNLFDFLIGLTKRKHAPVLYYRARLAIDEKNVDQAKECLKEAIALDPNNVDYLTEFARLTISTNQIKEAYDAYQRLSKLDSTSQEYKVFLPLLTYLSGDKNKAMEMINEFERENGFNIRLSGIKREFLIENKLYDSLENYTMKQLEADPNDVETLINGAQVSAAKGKDSLALAYYNKAVEVGRGELGPYIALSDFYRIRRDIPNWTNALKMILGSSEVNVKYKIEQFLELIRNVGKDKVKAGQLDEVAQVMVESENSDGNYDDEITKLYIEFLLFKEDFVTALSYCDTLFKQNKLPSDLNRLYLQLLHQNKLEKQAREVGCQLVKNNPENVDLSILVAYLYAQDGGDKKKAMEMFNSGVKNAPTDSLKSVAYGARGDYYYELKKPRNYYADYKEALRYDANNALVLNNLAYFMALDGKDLNQAWLYVKKANELSEQNATYLDTQAWVNYLMGRYDEAKRLMLLVMAYDRNPSADVLMHYGDILYALGEDFMARENWNKALNAGADKKEVEKRLAQPKAVK